MFGFSKLSGQWYCRKFPTFRRAETWAGEVAINGDVACLCDDVEYFAEQMGLEIDDIEMIEPE